MTNYFAHQSAAERYARNRPYFHALVIERVRTTLNLARPFARSLDAACGTGQSTQALKTIADEIVAADLSVEMLTQALPHPQIRYLCAAAEALPLRDGSFELITVALAFHWFKRERFLAEASRLLQPDGWLILYNNWFSGRMLENPAFERWNRTVYQAHYPTPLRNSEPLSAEMAQAYGFRLVEQQKPANEITFSVDELAGYLMTQSNVIAAVERGATSEADVFAWLTTEIAAFFPNTYATFVFGNQIDYFQKQ